jgi:hypothetical protein
MASLHPLERAYQNWCSVKEEDCPDYWERLGVAFSEVAKLQKMVCWVMNLAPWQAFATLTFPWEASEQSAINSYLRFMRKKLGGVNHFFAIEPNPSRDGHHVHAMWAQSGEIRRKDAWQAWFDRYGRARIEPLRNWGQVTAYCAKYCINEGSWWNVVLVDPQLRRCAARGEVGRFEQLAFSEGVPA